VIRPIGHLLATVALLLSTAAASHEYTVGTLQIGHPYAPSTPSLARTAAAYLSITNKGDAADRLLAASSPRAQKVELHTHIMEDNIARMREVPAVDIAPGATATFQQGGMHIMLVGLTAPLTVGEKVPLTLRFERAGSVDVELVVERTARRPAASEHHGH
jgi:periplasmic copper chaperone A